MASAISARQDGDEWQAYLFWQEAVSMLFGGEISAVGFEVDEFRAFDDIAVNFSKPRQDGRGGLVDAEYYQIKFSAAFTKKITADSLIDPKFINADSVSLLERLRDAVRLSRANGKRCRFSLVAPWPVDSDDDLGTLVDTSTGAIRLTVLRVGKTDISEMGKVRKKWRDVLKVDDDELFDVLQHLCISPRFETLESARRRLNMGFSSTGLKLIPDCTVTDQYAQLIWKLHKQGKQWYSPEDILTVCKQEELYVGLAEKTTSPPARVLGVRSFMRWAENLEDETDAMVCVTEHFSQRQVKEASLWQSEILPRLQKFFSSEIKPGSAIDLELQTHASLAFATGYLVEPKAGVKVGVRQRSIGGIERWAVENPGTTAEMPVVNASERSFGGGDGLACAFSVTHDIRESVSSHLSKDGFTGRLLELTLESQSQTAVANGHQAYQLASVMTREIAARRGSSASPVHLFLSAPNGLVFLVGQLSRALGEVQLYEFDFGSTKEYSRSVLLSPSYALA
jgi:hypothetical protein